MAQAKRVVRFEAAAKSHKETGSPIKAYGPRQHGKAATMKFRASQELKDRIEAEAEAYEMSVSNYLAKAIATLIDLRIPVNLERRK